MSDDTPMIGQEVPESKLYPTKSRLALLEGVQAGEVQQHVPLMPDPMYDEWRWDGGRRVVTKRMQELERAGWVTCPRRTRFHESVTWEITAEGERVLSENTGDADA